VPSFHRIDDASYRACPALPCTLRVHSCSVTGEEDVFLFSLLLAHPEVTSEQAPGSCTPSGPAWACSSEVEGAVRACKCFVDATSSQRGGTVQIGLIWGMQCDRLHGGSTAIFLRASKVQHPVRCCWRCYTASLQVFWDQRRSLQVFSVQSPTRRA
jgi:hypothetical protein